MGQFAPVLLPTRASQATWWRGHACLWVLLVAELLAGGCRRETTSPAAATGPATADVEITLNTPEEATRSLLRLLRVQVAAAARGDREAANRTRDRVAEQIVARSDAMARYRKAAGAAAQDEARALGALVESWAAVANYYAAGLQLNQTKLAAVGADATGAVADVPAHGPHDQAVLRVACVRDTDGQWHVTAIGFAPPEKPAPAPSPASTQSARDPRM